MLFLKLKLCLVALGLICASPAVLAQAQVARVLEAKGTALLERAGQLPRLLGAGEPLNERDVVNVARDSWAILEFNDQTRVTLRPNTVFRLDAYKADAPESMLLGLAKGGLRVVTGLLGKRNPQGVKVQTAVATIGIRGTEFDARLCAEDCASEEKAKPAPRPLLQPAARVVEMGGVVAAGRADEAVRLLVPGAMLNEGDAVAVGRGGSALLVFRDGARVVLVENSRLAINRFRYNEVEPREASAFLTLYAGNALVTTGQLAKIGPDAFLFRTALGVVRPFGTTFGGGGCIGSFCASGSVTVNSDGASASGSASGGGASASGSTSVGSGGASASGEVNKPGGGGVSGTLNLGPNTDTTQMAKTPAGPTWVPIPYPNLPSAAAVNEVVNGVQQVVNEVTGNAASQGRSAAGAARQRATETVAAGQDRLQAAARNAVDAATEKVAADQKIAEQKLAAAKAAAEAKSTQIEASGRSYDISGGVIAVVGPPDLVASPGILQTLPGEPVVERSADGKTVTTRWNETMVGTVRTLHGGTALSGNVQRTEIAGPEGTTTILVFNVMFADPSITPGLVSVPRVGGPLVSLGPGRGTIQVTHRAPDGTTTTSYPANLGDGSRPSSVAVVEGEVEIVGRGRVREGEMLASSGSPVRVPGLTKTSLARAGGDPFGSTEKAVEEGLYVWVRDGAVQVAKDNQSVDVGAGNAAVATKDRVRLLDAVPNFLRFDSTPRPFPALGESKVDVFRAADGALLNMCSIR